MSDSKPVFPEKATLSEKDRRAQALQKALRENLRRRKAAAVTATADDHENTTGADAEKR